jgi:ABC-2 type transport system ATP-binding protein
VKRVLLAAERLTKIFPGTGSRATAALLDVTLDLRENEVLALVGANGAGKTTFVDLCATLIQPTSGGLRVADEDALECPAGARRRIGYLPSGSRSLYPRLTALQNLEFFASLHGFCPAEARPRADAALRLCGALDAARIRVDRLSDGLVARVALARTLLHDPSVLLLDEPTRSLDPVHRPRVLRALRHIADQPGKAILLVTHDLDDVFEIADRVALMHDGRLVRVSPVASARQDRSTFAAVLSGAGA